MNKGVQQPRLVVADSRDRSEPLLQQLLARAGAAHDVELVTTSGDTLEALRREPRALLVQVDVDPCPDMPPAGPLLASLAARADDRVPTLLYAPELGGGHERRLAQLGVRAPVVVERRLVADFDEIVSDLLTLHESLAALSELPHAPADEPADGVPPGFRIDRFLDEVDAALLNASAREHPDRTVAAAAVRVPVETFDVRRRQQALDRPGAFRPASNAGPSLLWCSRNPPPQAIRDACGSSDIGIRTIEPGSLHPKTLMSAAAIAAIVEPTEPAGAADAWLLRRSVRPFLLVGRIPAPVKFLLRELRVEAPWIGSTDALPTLLGAGRIAARLHGDEDPALRLPFGRGGIPAWPTDADKTRRTLDARVLLLADATLRPAAKAAAALGLADSTYRARLARAKRT